MPDARYLAGAFRNGDLPFCPRGVSTFWVVKTVSRDPVRATQVYAELIRYGGGSHAAAMFLHLLERMCVSSGNGEFVLWWHLVLCERKVRPLPG